MSELDDQVVGQAEAAVDTYVDEDWANQFDGMDDAGEVAPVVSGQTIPSFGYYHLRFVNGKGAISSGKAKSPMARLQAVVVNGPDGTVGERLFDDLYLRVSKTTTEDGVAVPKDADTYTEHCEKFQHTLNKIARIGSFELSHPTAAAVEALDAYAQQFGVKGDGGFDAICEVSESTDTWQGVTRTRNRIRLQSLRALDDPAIGKRMAPGTSAQEESIIKVNERNTVMAARAGGSGRTAASVSRGATLAG